MCHDIIHDLFEGMIPLEMKLLAYCLEIYFTVAELNAGILNFGFLFEVNSFSTADTYFGYRYIVYRYE